MSKEPETWRDIARYVAWGSVIGLAAGWAISTWLNFCVSRIP